MASGKRSQRRKSSGEDARLVDSVTPDADEDGQVAAESVADEADDVVSDPTEEDSDQDADADQHTDDAEEARVVKRNRIAAPVKKAKPTPKARDAKKTEETKRTSPALFVRQSVGELKQVKWPTAQMVRQYFAVVLVFVLFVMTFVAGLDWIFGWLLLRALG